MGWRYLLSFCLGCHMYLLLKEIQNEALKHLSLAFKYSNCHLDTGSFHSVRNLPKHKRLFNCNPWLLSISSGSHHGYQKDQPWQFKEDVTATVLFLPRHYFLLAFHIVPVFFFPTTEGQTLGAACAATAKSPKTDSLQKHSNLVCTANLGVNNTILVFN